MKKLDHRANAVRAIPRIGLIILSCVGSIGLTLCFASCGNLQQGTLSTLTLRLSPHDSLSGMPENSSRTAKSFSSTASARTFLPLESTVASTFRIQGTGPDQKTFTLEANSRTAKTNIAPGEWSIIVRAIAPCGIEVGLGTATVTMRPGKTTSTEMILYPREGLGDLSFSLVKNLDLPLGARYTGFLEHKGLPGKPDIPLEPTKNIDIPAEQPSLTFEDVKAGYYILALTLKEADGTAVGGISVAAFVLADFMTQGECAITMGNPVLTLGSTIYPTDPLPEPFMSADYTVSSKGMPLPLAIPPLNPETGLPLPVRWFQNGSDVGIGFTITEDRFIPAGTSVYPYIDTPDQISLVRIDGTVTATATGKSSDGHSYVRAENNVPLDTFQWRALYDYTAAMKPSLRGSNTGNDIGTGTPYDVKAVATSETGLIAVAGLDGDGGIHLFAAAYGAQMLLSDGVSPWQVGYDAAWIRLWRDRIRIGSDYRTADRLAISANGRFVAAASSTATWLRIYTIAPDGSIEAVHDFTETLLGLAGSFSSLRALDFSTDSQSLFVLSNSSEAVHEFDLGTGVPVYKTGTVLTRKNPEVPLAMRDMIVTSTGMVVASAEDASRIYFLDTTSSPWTETFIEGSSASSRPYKPAALALSAKGDGFHVLCNESAIARYERASSLEPYAEEGYFAFSANINHATYMAVGPSSMSMDPDEETICLAGSETIGYLHVRNGHLANGSQVLADPSSINGIATAEGIAFIKEALILAGGTAGVATVVGGIE